MLSQVDFTGWDCADVKLSRATNIVLSNARESYKSVPTISWTFVIAEGGNFGVSSSSSAYFCVAP